MNGHSPDCSGLDRSLFIGPDLFVEDEPVCLGGGTYTWLHGNWPKVDVLLLSCSCEGHIPEQFHDR